VTSGDVLGEAQDSQEVGLGEIAVDLLQALFWPINTRSQFVSRKRVYEDSTHFLSLAKSR